MQQEAFFPHKQHIVELPKTSGFPVIGSVPNVIQAEGVEIVDIPYPPQMRMPSLKGG